MAKLRLLLRFLLPGQYRLQNISRLGNVRKIDLGLVLFVP
jgi:hypothetical protein